MSEAIIHRAFFGDARRDFTLTPALILELERQTGVGIGALCQHVFRNDFHYRQITETIRLGLIGGGEDPEAAVALIAAYVEPRPIVEAYTLALTILETAMMGAVQDVARKRAPKQRKAQTHEA